MHGKSRNASRAIEASATGAWLGATQLLLGYSLMTGAGASASLYFGMTALWLAGGIAGVLSIRGARSATVLLLAAIAGAIAARAALAWAPFSRAALFGGLGAGALAGAYAGAFLGERSVAWGRIRALLLHENNGFVAGYALGGVLLLTDLRALEWFTATLGVALLGVRSVGIRSEPVIGSSHDEQAHLE